MSENNYIQQLERAVRVLINSNSNWAMNISDGDEQLIWDLQKAMDKNPPLRITVTEEEDPKPNSKYFA